MLEIGPCSKSPSCKLSCHRKAD